MYINGRINKETHPWRLKRGRNTVLFFWRIQSMREKPMHLTRYCALFKNSKRKIE
jgi:hypothetical protein